MKLIIHSDATNQGWGGEGNMTRENNRRSIVSGGEETLHKYAGINSSQIDNNDFYYNKDEDNFHSC